MKRVFLICLCVLGVSIAAAYSFPAGPVGVSPGVGTGEAVIGSVLPTFSWSAVEGAVGYRLEVFKAIEDAAGHEETAQAGEVVLRVDIPAPALSWSPSGSEALLTGESYVWFIKAFDSDGEGEWSIGNRFRIDASVALTGMDEAVKEKVREYVRTDNEIRTAIKEIKEEGSGQDGAGTIAATSGEGPEGGRLKGTEGPNNTFYGLEAGNNTTGGDNTFVGRSAGYSNTNGFDNTFVGRSTGYANTTGGDNTFVGRSAGYSNTIGDDNTFVGRDAGYSNTTSYDNTFVGRSAGYSNINGYYNTFVGRSAGNSNTTGYDNTFVGRSAGYANTTGYDNTFVGKSAGFSNTTGDCNTFVGRWAGNSNTEGNGNVLVGYRAGYNETSSNRLYIHNSESSNPLIYGEFDNRVLKINGSLSIADVSSPSDISLKRNIQPLDGALEKVASLKGVSYNWRTEEYPEKGFSRDRQIGLIAQDVEKVLPELVRTDKDGKKSVSYDKLTAVLVEAIKAQQGEIRTQESRLSAQNAEMENQKAKLSAQQAEIEELRGLVRQITSRNL